MPACVLLFQLNVISIKPGNTKGGKYDCTIESAECCFYLQNRLIQTSLTGGQRYSYTSPLSNPWLNLFPCDVDKILCLKEENTCALSNWQAANGK